MLIFLCFPYGLYGSCERDRIWVFGFHLGYACCCNVWVPLGHDSNSSAGRSCAGFLVTFYFRDIWILIIFSIIQSFDFFFNFFNNRVVNSCCCLGIIFCILFMRFDTKINIKKEAYGKCCILPFLEIKF